MSLTPLKTIAVLGATGNVGQHIVSALLASNFTVIAMTRASSRFEFPSEQASSPNLRIVKLPDDLPSEALVSAFEAHHVDAAVNAIQGNFGAGELRLIDAAIEAGCVRFFVPSDFGMDMRKPEVTALWPAFAARRGVVEYLMAREDRISWATVMVGTILDWNFEILGGRLTGIEPSRRHATLIEGGNAPFSAVTMPLIGRCVAALLTRPELVTNRVVALEGFRTTQREVLAVVQELVGGDKFSTEEVDKNTLIESARAKLAEGDPLAFLGFLQAAMYVEGYGGDVHEEAIGWMEKLELQGLDLRSEIEKSLRKTGFLV